MSLSSTEYELITKILKKYFPNQQAILFGSCRHNCDTESSDIDLALKGNGPLDRALWQIAETEFEESPLSRPVDLVDYLVRLLDA